MFAPEPYKMMIDHLNRFPAIIRILENSYSKFITVLIVLLQPFFRLIMVRALYAIWIKIDETLPWIELKGTHKNRRNAKRAADTYRNNVRVRIVEVPEIGKRIGDVDSKKRATC